MPDLSRDYDFGNALVANGALSVERVREALRVVEQSGGARRLEQVLLEKSWITQNDAAMAYRRMSAAPAPAAAPGGVTIPGFQVLNEVGAGSMGTVYRARQTAADRVVAIKIMSPKLAQSRENVERFLREAKAAARVQHPNVVAAYDVGQADGRPYLIMEYIEGTTGARLLRQNGKLEVGQVVDVGLQMAEGLAAAHRAGLIHRDIRPEKTLFDKEGTVKLVDLGLASESRSLTGDMSMSAKYLSPELARGEKKIDIRADLYSLGCTLFHFITGELPYGGATSQEMAQRHANDPVPAAKLKRPEMGDRLNAVIYKLMQKRPNDRYQTPTELINDLKLLEARRKPIEVMPKAEAPAPEPVRAEPARAGPARSAAERYAKSGSSGGVSVVMFVSVAIIAGAWLFWDKLFPPPVKDVGPKPPVVVDDATAQRAKADIAAIEEAAEEDRKFERIEEVSRRFEVVAARYKGSTWEGAAIERKSEYLKRADAAAKRLVDEVMQKIAGLDARPREAIAELEKFPRRFLDLPSGAEIRQQIAIKTGNIAERTAKDKGEVERLVMMKKYVQALEKIEEMKEYALNQTLPDLEKREAEIVKLRNDSTSAVERELHDQYLQRESEIRRAMASRNHVAAAATLRDFLFRNYAAEQAAFVRLESVNYDPIRDACGDGEQKPWNWAALAKLCGDAAGDPASPVAASLAQRILLDFRNVALHAEFTAQVLQGLEYAFKAKDKEKYTLEAHPADKCFFDVRTGKRFIVVDGKRTIDFADPWAELGPIDHVQLAERSLDADRDKAHAKGSADPVQVLRGGLHLYYHEKGSQYWGVAQERIRRAITLGAKGAKPYEAYIRELLGAQEDRHCEEEFKRAQGLAGQNRWAEAKRILEMLSEKKSTSGFVGKFWGDITDLDFKVTEKLRAERGFEEIYHGRVETREDGRLRVTYDFETKGQLDAFEVLGGKGKWTLDRGALGSSGDQCAVRWRTPAKGDVEVEYDLTPVDEAQNLACNLYWNAEGAKHYSVVFGFDIVFGKEDPKNEREDAYDMPRTCVLKYPLGVAANHPDHIFNTFWDNLKKRVVGKAQGNWPLRKGVKAHVKIVRAGKKISLTLDGAAMWEGEDADYNEGSILWYADSRARIDNVAVTFKP